MTITPLENKVAKALFLANSNNINAEKTWMEIEALEAHSIIYAHYIRQAKAAIVAIND